MPDPWSFLRRALLLPLLILTLTACSTNSAVRPPARDYDVRILRDSWGVPHIFGKTDADAAYGLAWAHAEDDFETIQGALFAARGRLATLLGPQGAPNDYYVQLVDFWSDVNSRYETELSPETRALCEGYAAGINAWVLHHPDRAHPDFLSVTGKDVVAGFAHKTPLFFGLDKTLGQIASGDLADAAITETPIVRDVKDSAHADDESTAAAPDAISLGAPELHMLDGERRRVPVGSNTFAVAPSRSADGITRLAVNSHQPWTGPVAWYEAHLVSEEGLDVVGGTFPGSPLILHGHNRNLGWAHTVNSPDLIDVYRLTVNPANRNQYLLDGEWRDFEVREARIRVKLLGPIHWTFKREVLESVHGPAMRSGNEVYAMRYAGRGRIGAVEQWYRMNRAENFDQWLAGMRLLTLPMFNTAYADRSGNIFYIYNALLPVRAEGYDWQGILPGDRSELVWDDYLPFDRLPQVKNPQSGFVINCNGSPFFTTLPPDNPDPADYSPTFGIETYSWNREMRAMDLFGSDESITEEEFKRYKYDMTYDPRSRFAQIVRAVLEAPEPEDELLREARRVLAAWDYTVTPENTSAAIAVMTAYPLVSPTDVEMQRNFRFELEDALSSFEEAARTLKEHHGRIDVPWHEVNRLVRGDVDVGMGGGPFILHAVYGDLVDGRYIGRAGDSYVLLVEWGPDGVSSESIHQFGSATLDEDSPHYADQAPVFAHRRRKPVWLDEADIRAHLKREYRPGKIGS